VLTSVHQVALENQYADYDEEQDECSRPPAQQQSAGPLYVIPVTLLALLEKEEQHNTRTPESMVASSTLLAVLY